MCGPLESGGSARSGAWGAPGASGFPEVRSLTRPCSSRCPPTGLPCDSDSKTVDNTTQTGATDGIVSGGRHLFNPHRPRSNVLDGHQVRVLVVCSHSVYTR